MDDFRKEVEAYLYYCQYQKKLDEKTIQAYRNDLKQFADYIELLECTVNKESINAYIVLLHQKYKQKSVKRKLSSMKALYYYWEDEGKIGQNPFHSVKTKFKEEQVLPRTIPKEIIEKLLIYLYARKASKHILPWERSLLLRDIAVVEMLFATGMRISELCGLKDEMFDIKEGVLCIRGKGSKERFIQIGNSEVLTLLETYRTKYSANIQQHGYFFVNRYGNKLSEQSARRMIHKHVQEADITMKITPHMFRHAFATLLLEEDVDIRYIQKMLGHSSIMTTQIYTYVTSRKQKEILRMKHPRNRMMIGETGDKS